MAVAVPEDVGAGVADATAPAPTRPRFVLVGGVPGAGKTTVINGLATQHPEVVTVDPDRLRRRLAAVLPDRLPYRSYRAVVHVCTAVVVLFLLVRGPGRPLVVHDPATRRRRRTWTGRLARRRGWDPVLVVVDVSRGEALAGQHARGRVLAPAAFDGHWRRWQHERPGLVASSLGQRGDGPWSGVHLVDRDTAGHTLAALVQPGAELPGSW